MSKPTPVTTSSITAESASNRRPMLTLRLPVWSVQLQSVVSLNGVMALVKVTKLTSAHTNAAAIKPQPSQLINSVCSWRLKRRRLPITRNPSSGSSSTSGVKSQTCIASPPHGISLVYSNVAPRAEDRNDNRQPHHHFSSSHRQDEKDENPAIYRIQIAGKGHKREVHSVEHQLNRHEDNQRVAPHQHAHDANCKQHRADD